MVPCWVLSGELESCSVTFPRALSFALPDKCMWGDDLSLPVPFWYVEGTRRQLEMALPLSFHAVSWKYCRAGVIALGWGYFPRLVEPCSSRKYPHFCELGET